MKKKPGEPVSANCAYSSHQLCAAAGISPPVLRAAVRKGLPFVALGHTRHFTGKAWLDWVESQSGKYDPEKSKRRKTKKEES